MLRGKLEEVVLDVQQSERGQVTFGSGKMWVVENGLKNRRLLGVTRSGSGGSSCGQGFQELNIAGKRERELSGGATVCRG